MAVSSKTNDALWDVVLPLSVILVYTPVSWCPQIWDPLFQLLTVLPASSPWLLQDPSLDSSISLECIAINSIPGYDVFWDDNE